MLNLFVTIAILCNSLCSTTNLGVYDLFMLSEVNDIQICKNYLEANTDFNYVGFLGKNKEGWDVYKFSDGTNWIEIGRISGTYNGQFMDLTDVHYYIKDNFTYQYFIQSLKDAGFVYRESGEFDNGVKFFMYNGTKTLKDKLRMVAVAFYSDYYEIGII
jgi:hypothetical protein